MHLIVYNKHNTRGLYMKTSKLFISLFVGLFLFFGCEDLMNNESITLDEDLQALSEGINADIGLSRTSMDAITKSMDKHGKKGKHKEPGFLWNLASDMQSDLSDEEKSKIFQWVNSNSVPYLYGRGNESKEGKGHHEKDGDIHIRLIVSVLNEAQLDSLKNIMDSYRQQMRSVMEQYKNGDIDDDAAKSQLQALDAAMNADIKNLLTDEQQSEIEAKIAVMKQELAARKEAERQAMINATGMTNDQEASLLTINQEHEASVKALFETMKNSDSKEDYDRKAMHEALKALMVQRNAKIENLFDADQMEVIMLHTFAGMQYQKHCNKSRDKDGKKEGGDKEGKSSR